MPKDTRTLRGLQEYASSHMYELCVDTDIFPIKHSISNDIRFRTRCENFASECAPVWRYYDEIVQNF